MAGSSLGWAAGVKLWQTEPLGPTWNLHARMPMYATYATIDSGNGKTSVVTPITNGATVVAFDVSERADDDPPSVPACDGAQRSWHLGGLTAWAGEVAHAAVVTGGVEQSQLVIGTPGVSPTDTSFTVSARPLDTTGDASFSHFSESLEWRMQLVVDRGGRTAEGFPPHWLLAAEFPHPGCWEIHIAGDHIDDTVVIPVPTAEARTLSSSLSVAGAVASGQDQSDSPGPDDAPTTGYQRPVCTGIRSRTTEPSAPACAPG